jgi:coenzyme F420-reducing hydrogenase delta subunit
MKILHLAQERDSALVAPHVLHGIAQNVTLTWVQTPASALQWLQGTPDAAAVIVEVQAQSCASFVEQLRGLGLTTPVVVVAGSARLELALAPLNSGADGYLVAGPSLETDLPRIVSAAIERERSRRQLLTQTLTDLQAGRERAERQLASAEQARQDIEERSASELAAAAARLADVEGRHAVSLTRETRICAALQQRLFDLESALRKADERRASEAVSFADLLAKRHAVFTANLAQAARARDALTAAAEQLRRRESELRADLAQAVAGRTALGHALAEAEAAHQDTRQRNEIELAAANERQAALEDLLAQETDRRTSLDEKLAVSEAARKAADQQHTEQLTSAAAGFAELQARYDAALEENAAALVAASTREAELVERLTKESDARAALERDLTRDRMEAGRRRDRTRDVISAYRRRAREQKARLYDQLARTQGENDRVRRSLDQLQAAFQTLEQIAEEHAAERARLAALVADRESQMDEQAERHRIAEDALRRELDAARAHAEALRGVAERVPDLQAQLERSQHERRRQFERAPYALCRCSPSGAIVEANHSFVTLLGCRRVDELRNTDFAAAALERAGDLGWLLERARTTRKTETVETQWKTREGRRLILRLQALSTATESIDIVAEDITDVRELEERLRQSQRMEAVGRLAPEVAVTCDALLTDVARGAYEWLAEVGGDEPLRRQAERLLSDVTRAASFLRQLGIYGHEQVRALEPVSAQRVLRDLAPVLKRLVGDRIALVLPKSAGSFDVDVDAERLERVLINVAGYARQRMPGGGQVRIDLATTAVGRRFVARYSNVRPGEHVLITVTELPAADESRIDGERRSRSADKPGVDLGVLVDLIASCGGHLWMEAQPAGNMVVKIHLPKPAAATATDNRGRRLSRWFRSTPAAHVGA